MRLVLAAILAAFFMSAAHAQEQAQPRCFPLEVAEKGLEQNYGEVIVMNGLTDSGKFFVMFANVESGTWTLLAVTPDGIACYLTSGQNFRSVQAIPGNDA